MLANPGVPTEPECPHMGASPGSFQLVPTHSSPPVLVPNRQYEASTTRQITRLYAVYGSREL